MKSSFITKLLKLIAVGVCTLVLTLIGLAMFSRLVTPKASIESYYDEPRNTIDALFIGSSHCAFSASPIDIYKASGIKTYNVSTPCQPSWVNYYYVREALKYQKPKVVFLEVFDVFYDKSYATVETVDEVSTQASQKIKPSLDLLLMNLARYTSQITPLPWDDIFNVAKYHSRLTALEPQDISDIFTSNYGTGKGFGPMLTHESFEGFVPPVTDRREPLYEKCDKYLRKSIDLLKERGIDVVLFKTPFITKEMDMATLNTITDIATEKDVPFLNFCENNPLGIDYALDMGDEGHINYFGSEKASKFFADYLLQNYGELSNANAPDALWDAAVKAETEDFVRVKFRMMKTIDDLLVQSRQYDNVDIIVLKQGELSAGDLAIIKETNPAIEQALLDTIESHPYLVINGGKIYTGNEADKRIQSCGISISFLPDGTSAINKVGSEDNYSRMRDGLNLALYDHSQDTVFHNFSFAREHGFTYYTS